MGTDPMAPKTAVILAKMISFVLMNRQENDVALVGGNKLQNSIMSAASLPLVSVLIPTYNRPEYFELALKSVLAQTYGNIEIIVGDDSNDDRTGKLIMDHYRKYRNIKYMI